MESSEKIVSNADNSAASLDRRICVAPMMDYTDRHFRFLLRLLSPNALLYTEMVTTQAILRGDVRRLLEFDASEHPVALQLGGSEPKDVAAAARIGAEFGYDEINLNCGCPSDRVHSGRFGACLMAEPERVAECVAAMRAVVTLPVTVKCRIAIEPRPQPAQAEFDFLQSFIERIVAAGCDAVILHARSAVLGGLTPKENREIPPLRFDVAHRLRRAFPRLTLVVNGGIRSRAQVSELLQDFDGVMLGRAICDNPYFLAELHTLRAPAWRPEREHIVMRYAEYVRSRVAARDRLAPMLRHALALFAGQPGARAWRRFLSERATLPDTAAILEEALALVARPASPLGRTGTD